MIHPARAAVRPRVIVPETNDTILLEDLASEFRGDPGDGLAIMGGHGSGKSVALAHLAARMGDDRRFVFLDEPSELEVAAASRIRTTIIALREPWPSFPFARVTLAPWTNDDLVEYLLARHPERCGAVMRRIAAAADRTMHQGRPELCAAVLEQMAEDEALATVADALQREIRDALVTPGNLHLAHEFAVATLAREVAAMMDFHERLRKSACEHRAFRLLRHGPIQLLLAADGLAAMLAAPTPCRWLQYHLPRRLVNLAAPMLTERAVKQLRREVCGRDPSRHAMAASLLHAAGQSWLSHVGKTCNLTSAYLSTSYWAALRLEGITLHGCDLSLSNLSGVVMEQVAASNANFAFSDLSGASLSKIKASGAKFTSANLSSIKADFADFDGADFTGADLRAAKLHGAVLRGAILRGAQFDGADLRMANLRGTRIEDAGFENVDFEQADLMELPLRLAKINGAEFCHARMSMCDLEETEAPGANFAWADLMGANLTAAQMSGANFSHACLKGAKLADVNWQGANLTNADLTGCTFHFGSSRCGLVGSPIASEGSRTGFYGDEVEERLYCPVEQIRKANLVGADLSGAKLEGTDFYLVDLRRAKYTADQFDHLRRTGAILFDRD